MNAITRYLIDFANWLGATFPWLGQKINALAITLTVNACRHRPHPWSTAHDYISWTSLTDKTWSSRHLPAKTLNPPKLDQAENLFKRPNGQQRLCAKSTCVFPAFAQYLTDGFIRTRMPNKSQGDTDELRKHNNSNHEIDLSPLYGRTGEQIAALRLKSETPGERGKLKSQFINGEEYAPFLLQNGEIKPEFAVLDRPLMLDKYLGVEELTSKVFAFGGDRANASPQVAMMNTLFLREHNRLAGAIELAHPDWNDERVFETARNANIVLFIKIVVEEYINHISPGFKFKADPSVAWNASWNRPNWISTEFSLLYRWHPLIPNTMRWGGVEYGINKTLMNNNLLLDNGLKQGFVGLSQQAAGQIGPFNTANDLLFLEKIAINQGRLCRLASYSDYRAHVSLPRPLDFSDISKSPAVVELLRSVYEKVEDVEFYVGLFAEDHEPNTPLPPLLGKMVAVDAFSQALTNPLLSENVWPLQDKVFSVPGWKAITETSSLRDIIERNSTGLSPGEFVGMTRPGWKPVY